MQYESLHSSQEDIMKKRTTIFRQLVLNVVIPVVIAMLGLGILNYINTVNFIKEANNQKNRIVTEEIRSILTLQNAALEIIERPIVKRLKNYSSLLVEEYFANTENIKNANLTEIRNEITDERDSHLDIYIIKKNGEFVNSIGGKDIGLNFYSFGKDHTAYFKSIIEGEKFVNGGFTIEASTKQPKLFTYQPTRDGNYVVELGYSSKDANSIIQSVKDRINKVSGNKMNAIESAKLIINADSSLFSLTKEEVSLKQRENLFKIFKETKEGMSFDIKKDDQYLHYEYIYLPELQHGIYSYVIQIISDRTQQIHTLRWEVIKNLGIFIITLILVVILIYRKTRIITNPIKKLVDNVMRITGGHFNERADVEGNNEIAKLSEQFNLMIETIENYYNELEQKVRERTAEIVKQKEEIEAQRDAIESQRDELAEKNTKLKSAYDKIDAQKKDIMDSIHYAKRIQSAILPPDPKVKKLLPHSFILFRPKDIVSGDFYWIGHNNNKVIITAVDCTGHGVPGAFMSIVGSNQLNNVVKEGIDKPSEILNGLNYGVTHLLEQKREDGTEVRDGMDMALCTIDFNNNILQYAGAFNPLYQIRNGELNQIKANKFPIGNFVDEEMAKFSNHELEIRTGDFYYIFSDGYMDQFGGPQGRKFMSKRFKNKLLEIHQEPPEQQKNLLEETLDEWMKGYEQVDDILIIGFKI